MNLFAEIVIDDLDSLMGTLLFSAILHERREAAWRLLSHGQHHAKSKSVECRTGLGASEDAKRGEEPLEQSGISKMAQ